MSSLRVSIIALLGVVQSALELSGTEVDLTVKPGDNVTLYCDMMWAYGKHTYWYRNCSHYRQPPFVISTNEFRSEQDFRKVTALLSSYGSEWNSTSQSHDLLIKNITESELGVYYCSVAEIKVIYETVIQKKLLHSFGNITYKLSFEVTPSPPPSSPPPNPDFHQCWSQLAILCPVCALFSALISSTCVYCLCRSTTGPVQRGERLKERESCTGKQDEDGELCYASLDVPTRAHTAKSKRKRTPTQNSDFSTYSEVKTHRV